MLYTASAFNDALRDADGVEEGYHIFSQLDDKWGKAMSSYEHGQGSGGAWQPC